MSYADSSILFTSHVLLGIALAALLHAGRRSVRTIFGKLKDRMTPEGDGLSYDLVLTSVSAGLAVAVFLALTGMSPWLGLSVGAAVTIVLPGVIVRLRKKKYREAFDKVLAESLMTISSSLKAGLTLKDSLEVAAENCPPPFSVEVARALKEYRFGLSIEEALESLRQRVATIDTKISFGALIIGSQLGGKLPEILQKIVKTIRERERVEGRLKALTAQGRAQATLLCAAPPVLAAGLFVYDPNKMALMTDTLPGQILLGLAIALELIGIAATLKVMKLDV